MRTNFLLFSIFLTICIALTACSDDPQDQNNQQSNPSYNAFGEVSPSIALDLARKSGCLACHSVEKHIVGPAWSAVSDRYKDDPGACINLVEKVKHGGKGNWTEVTGGVPMPPYSPRVSDENIADLVAFILGIDRNDCGFNNPRLTVNADSVSVEIKQGEQTGFFLSTLARQLYSVDLSMVSGTVDVLIGYTDVQGEFQTITNFSNVNEPRIIQFLAGRSLYEIIFTAQTDASFELAVNMPPQDAFLSMAKLSGCLACHSTEKKVVGPSFLAVSERYRYDPNAADVLIEKVKNGGKGNWTDITGGAPMPPYSPRVSDESIYQLVNFILGLRSANNGGSEPVYLPTNGVPLTRDLGQGEQLAFRFVSIIDHSYNIDLTVRSGSVDMIVETLDSQVISSQSNVTEHTYAELDAMETTYQVVITVALDASFSLSVTDTTPVPVPQPLDLAKQSGCLACHSVDKKVVGPSWRAVSERYYNNPDAEALLIEKVKRGGKGNWPDVTGGAPMPPYSPRVADADIQTLVRFILDISGSDGPVSSTFLPVNAPPIYLESNAGETVDFYFLSYSQRTYAVGINVAKGLVDVSVQSAGVADPQTVVEHANVAGETTLEFAAAANKHTISFHAVEDSGFYVDVSDVTAEQPPPDTLVLAKQSGCLACHAVDKIVVGPSWQAVSERYLNDPNAEAFLIEKVKKGGKGSWGEVTGGAPMPPYSPRVSDENIAVLVRYILNITE